MNAMSWADRNLKAMGDFDAFVSGGRVWRSNAAHDQAARLASGLLAMGAGPGERVLLWLPNSPDLAICWRAALRAGCVAVVAHHSSPLQKIRQLVTETQPTAMVTLAGLGQDSLGQNVRHRIQISSEESPGWIGVGRLLAEHRPLNDPIPRSDDDVAFIQYTSGSTGTPKGVMTRHGALGATLRSLRRRLARWRRPVRHLSVLPMSSSFGSLSLFEGLARRSTHFILDRFDPEAVLHAVQTHRIERTFLVPAMCEAILAVPDIGRFDLSSLRSVVCGGAIVPPDLIERFKAACGVRIDVTYGMTGVGGVSRASPTSKSGSVGRPFRDFQAKVVDPQGHVLPVGEVGELLLYLQKGRAVEYWNPAAPASLAASPEGWHRTGDLARLDADGELFVIGRSDDLIIQGGHNVHGESVAEIVGRLPGVRECAVVGVPSDFLGQEVVACVARRQGSELAAGDIIAHCRKHLEPLAVPTKVWFVGALPRNESGKVKNFELRDAIQAARGGARDTGLYRRLAATLPSDRHALLRQEVLRILRDVVSEPGSGSAPTGASFQEIGLDSLGAVELSHVLGEAIGRPVPATLAYSHPTVEAACDLLLELMGWQASGRDAAAIALPAPAPEDAKDLRLEAFLAPTDLDAAGSLAPSRDFGRGAEIVLLTGANGFAGRFIALEILSRLPATGRLYCLVRASSHGAALKRFREAYGSDPALQGLLDREFESARLVVLGGDLTQPQFGLPEETYDRLCKEVDCIVHNAAVVDHVLGYRDLFAPNVLGTVEIIRFALARQTKAINYVSTIATQRQDGQRQEGTSSAPGKAQPAAGYTATKRVSETLLKELHDRFDIPVRVYRPSYIMAHSEAPGQINAQDTLTRLLHGIVTTSLAPRSFYVPGGPATGACYDGLPVDTVAQSIAALSMAGQTGRAGYAEYNIVNPHCDVGLDAIVDWVKSAGYRLERVNDYGLWYDAFRSRLNGLSRLQRQQSLLPLLHTWEHPRARARANHDTAPYRRDLAKISQASGTLPPLEAPRITEAFIHKCLKDMRTLGLIGGAG